ncbi:hypothetical protein EMIHUDRAFT_226796 [Emiliania huxleyi CCMP1516]|uniref:Uncharacterized protein n=2 Tax=Emiliania huxleyi TaxID=2903 RepID=A0A0D3KKA5_EMIH1|nr:hypothetical protein EMIHUDRAFT_226796 [Emiliania huxleyi CCMP1516]EOD36190.1 hypothetical protein EMIHUDRAFT_226796 [Emiliania huxleyi CCMP1516]|eukprot:XP_005788619.1 hypothetical protein EMIHUDRAFT_226796 [Emiliania huxleyi CCMP1516]
MVDYHRIASGVCEKERKSELNTRARLGKGCGTPPKAPREELLLPPGDESSDAHCDHLPPSHIEMSP